MARVTRWQRYRNFTPETFKRGLGKFQTATWKQSEEIVQNEKDFPYILTTNRELEHYNCGTMTRRTGNVVILKDDVLIINPGCC
ncbi:MAG: hypothetical protein IPP29_09965 [Bacteroidetes bacterium]|nr:hypothetical protein [Bacteroidota bacterium]